MKKTIIASVFAATSILSQGAGIHTGLLNYWELNTDASDTASGFAESTGVTTDNGSVNGTTSFAPGLFGNAASLPGGAGNNITVADGGASTAGGVANDVDRTGSSMTLSVWIQAAEWNTGWQGIVSHGEGTDYRLARNRSRNPVEFAGVAGTGDIQPSTTYGPASPTDGAWHHLLINATDGGTSEFWINGVLGGSATGVDIQPSSGAGNNNNVLCIGCNPDNGREFNGLIDDVALWDRALTSAEVQQIYTRGLAGDSLGVIPEPSTGLLGGLAGLLLIARRRR